MTATVDFIVNPTLGGLTTDGAVSIKTALHGALALRLHGVRIRKSSATHFFCGSKPARHKTQ
jgi:hypothetical protein